MDPISHAVVGAAIGGLKDPTTPAALYWAAVAGAVIPDIDFVVRIVGGEAAYLDHHRGPTHGPIGWVVQAAVIAGLLAWISPGAPFGSLFLWALFGVLSHIALDLTKCLWHPGPLAVAAAALRLGLDIGG